MHEGLSLEDLWELRLLGWPGRTCGTRSCWAAHTPPPPIIEEAEIRAIPKNHQDTRNA